MTSTDDADPLWAEFRELLRWTVAAFGEPAALWETLALPRAAGAALRAWLKALEVMARALVVRIAARLPADAPHRRRDAHAPSSVRALRPSTQSDAPSLDDDAWRDSERWAGVRFVWLPPIRNARPRRHGPIWRAGLADKIIVTQLAYRLEALIRVAESPERCARRLARSLRRTPEALKRMLRAETFDGASVPREAVARAQAAAWAAFAAPSPAPNTS